MLLGKFSTISYNFSRECGDAPTTEKEETMIHVGRVCVKTAGRDAGRRCVVVDILDNTFALIDGETRRRKCNILHLEPLDLVVDIEKGASRESVAEALKKEGISARETKPKQVSPKPTAKRASPKTLPQATAEAQVKAAEKREKKKSEKPKTEQAKKKAG